MHWDQSQSYSNLGNTGVNQDLYCNGACPLVSRPSPPSNSFICSPGLGCHLDSRSPGSGSDGVRYKLKQDCEAKCRKPSPVVSKHCSIEAPKGQCVNISNDDCSKYFETTGGLTWACKDDGKGKCIMGGHCQPKF